MVFEGLLPSTSEITKIILSAVGAHYLDKVWSRVSGYFGFLGGYSERVGPILLSWLIYRYGGKLHPAVTDVGFGMLVVAVERAIAPYLPGSESVFKGVESNAREVDPMKLALEYVGRR